MNLKDRWFWIVVIALAGVLYFLATYNRYAVATSGEGLTILIDTRNGHAWSLTAHYFRPIIGHQPNEASASPTP